MTQPRNEQISAIAGAGHNTLVLAGAGTGKTTTIVGYIAWLLATKRATPTTAGTDLEPTPAADAADAAEPAPAGCFRFELDGKTFTLPPTQRALTLDAMLQATEQPEPVLVMGSFNRLINMMPLKEQAELRVALRRPLDDPQAQAVMIAFNDHFGAMLMGMQPGESSASRAG